MKFFLSGFLCVLLFNFSSEAQQPSDREILKLHLLLQDYLNTNQSPARQLHRSSEILLLMLDIDSIGYVSGVHLLADARNQDSVGSVLSKLNVTDFNRWHLENCSNKMLVLPIFGSAVDPVTPNSEYASRLFFDVLWSRQQPRTVLHKEGQVIFLSTYVY